MTVHIRSDRQRNAASRDADGHTVSASWQHPGDVVSVDDDHFAQELLAMAGYTEVLPGDPEHPAAVREPAPDDAPPAEVTGELDLTATPKGERAKPITE